MKGTSVTAITWSLCSAAYAPLLAVDLLCGNLRRQPFTFLLVQKNISLPCCVCLKTLPYTLQGENGYFHQAVDEYGVCQGASSFWRSLSHSLTHPIYIYTPILLEFSSPLFLYFSPGSSWTCSIVVGPPPLLSSFPHCLLVSHSAAPSSWAEGGHLAGPGAATQDMGHASAHRSCLVLQPVELPVFPSSAVRLLVSMVER